MARMRLCGSSSITRSTSRNGYRCGSRCRMHETSTGSLMASSLIRVFPCSFLGPGAYLTRQLVQLAEAGGVAAPYAGVLYRHAGGVFPRLGDRGGDEAHRRDHGPVADLQVAGDAGGASDPAVAADLRRAGHRHAAGHGGVRTDVDVVADLHLVVQAHVLLEHSVLDGAAVDGGVGADLAVVADADAAQLRHLDPVPVLHGQAEA